MTPIFLGMAGAWFIVFTIGAYISWGEVRSNRFYRTVFPGDELVDDFPVLTFIFIHLWFALQISFRLTIKIMGLADIVSKEKQKIKDIIRKNKE